MKFDELNKLIPYVTGGKAKVLEMHPYNAITLAMPGRHAKQTDPPGGDFVVMVDDDNLDWTKHQFTHTDIFNDVYSRALGDENEVDFIIRQYANIVCNGDDPDKISPDNVVAIDGCIHPTTFLHAVQCLAVAEHRRYAKYESKFGGRYLPFRFAAGIVEGLWSATDAVDKQNLGRPGVEWLEKERGIPVLTKQLMA